jgi:O-antigen/teichoic acid export membrane protein
MSGTHNPKKVAKSGAVYTAALIFQKILSFTYFSIIARALGPEQLGTYIFALSFAAFFSLVVDFGFVPLSIRTFSQHKDKQKQYFRMFFTVRIGFAILALVILHSVAFALGYDSTLWTLLGITSVIMIMDAFTAYFYTVFRSRQNLVYESIGTVIFQIIIFTTGLITITRTNDLRLLLGVIFVGSLFHLIFSSMLLARKTDISFKPYLNWQLARIWLARAFPFFLAAGFIKAYNTIDSILIKNLVGDEAVGLYAIPAKIVFTFPFIALAIIAAVYPAMSSYVVTSKEKLQSIFTRTLQLLLTISAPIAVGIYLLADAIVMRIWPEYAQSIFALQLLIWAVVFLYVEFPFGALLNATGNERRNTFNRGIQLVTFVALNLILIPLYGFMGAVYAALFCSVVIVFLGWLKARTIISVINKSMILIILKLGLSAYVMGEFVAWASMRISFIMIIPIAALIYVVMLLVLKVYTKGDLRWVRGLVHNK